MNLRADVVGTNVRLTDVRPGMVVGAQFFQTRLKGDADRASAMIEGTGALDPRDVAEAIRWAVDLPPHANANPVEIMPTGHCSAGVKIRPSA